MSRTCKCHGVSGSCSVKTCWHQMAHFGETAAVLKSKYDSAVQVTSEIRENSSHLRSTASSSSPSSSGATAKNPETNKISTGNKKLANRAKKASESRRVAEEMDDSSVMTTTLNQQGDKVNRKELVYLQRSPDFCVANALGPGTADRQCQRGENCDILCCGRGYNVHRLTVVVSCNCKLVLCCRVDCQTCLVEKTIHTCK